MNAFETLKMHNAKLVSEKYEEVIEKLYEVEPAMVNSLKIVFDGLGFYSQQLGEAIKEEQDYKKELMEANTYWYLNSKLRSLKERNKELKKEYQSIVNNVEYACKRALKICGMETA